MKGYLSRIASQIGLSRAGQGVRSMRGAGELRARTRPEPPERSETVMVPPPAKTDNAGSVALSPGSTPERPKYKNAAPKPGKPMTRAVSNPKTAAAPVLDTTARLEPGPANPKKMEALPSGKRRISKAAETEPTEIVKTVYVDPPAITEQHEEKTQEPGKNVPAVHNKPGSRKEKHHFSKTAEIIEDRDAERAEVQTVLLREIQEWVAAGNTEAAEPQTVDRPIEPVEHETEPLETNEAVSMTGPEPGVVRIGENKERDTIQKEASPIEEHSFDLSIGMISVVIEGDNQPPQPAPAQRADNRPDRQNCGNSRLSRNYL